MTDQQLIKECVEMRRLQKAYYAMPASQSGRKHDLLLASLQQEKLVDCEFARRKTAAETPSLFEAAV